MKIAVGSTNPVKVKAVENVMKKIYDDVEVVAVNVDSGVSQMPLSEDEGIKGAINRARGSMEMVGADLGVGLEGFMTENMGRHFLSGWCAIIDNEGETTLSGCYKIELPPIIVKKVLEGQELGPVVDEIMGLTNTKQKMGASGILTKGLIPRQKGWEFAVIYAMTKKLKPDLFK